jgi:hypothetical protein
MVFSASPNSAFSLEVSIDCAHCQYSSSRDFAEMSEIKTRESQ